MRYGMRLGAARFVAGDTIAQFLAVARRANAAGFRVVAGILGEDTRDERDALAAARAYCELLRQIAERRVDSTIALKATHLGLNVDKGLCYQHMASVAAAAQQFGNFVRLDMEQSTYVDQTLEIYRRLRAAGHDNVGFALQSYLYRSLDDLTALLPLQPNLRIVKGAYLEPPNAAFQRKADVDMNYMRLLGSALPRAHYTAIATHDRDILEAAIALVKQHRIAPNRFEFQMLYGISTHLAEELVARGYRVRLAIPYGHYWFPYLMRRLAERPANLVFFLRNVVGAT